MKREKRDSPLWKSNRDTSTMMGLAIGGRWVVYTQSRTSPKFWRFLFLIKHVQVYHILCDAVRTHSYLNNELSGTDKKDPTKSFVASLLEKLWKLLIGRYMYCTCFFFFFFNNKYCYKHINMHQKNTMDSTWTLFLFILLFINKIEKRYFYENV